MIRRFLGKVKRKLFGRKKLNRNLYENEISMEKPIHINRDKVIIHKQKIGESLPYIKELVGDEEKLIPHRRVTALNWNGPIMSIKGYYYLENIPMTSEDLVKKRLVLFNNSNKRMEISLKDVPIETVGFNGSIDYIYEWAGFGGVVNFATIANNTRPLPDSEYKVYIEIEVHVLGDQVYKKIFPLGNIEPFLEQGFHSAKMEYFTARREMKYNPLATYNQKVKTLGITSTKLKDFDPLELELDADKFKRGLLYRIYSSIGFRLLYKIYCILPIKKNKVLFASDSRTDMDGNFLFVYEEMIKRNLNMEYHFMFKNGVGEKKSLKELRNLAYHLATSRFILLDDFYPMVYPLKIRKNADLIQLWHAVGAFKTFGFSRVGRPGGPSPKSTNHRNYTKTIVSLHHVAKYYAEGFGIDEEKVIATGIPRTDIFYDENYKTDIKEKMYTKYPFLRDKKVITFAPTFRGHGQQSAHYPMEVLNLDMLYRELSDEYVFLFKIHPFVKNDFNIPYQYKDFFYNFSDYREINDLLFITDLLITDYSSVCFEFALLNKPMIFFAFDAEEYVRTRDFYYEYHSFIPGPLVRNTNDLVQTINDKNFKMEKIKPFVEYFFDHNDGKSSSRVIDQLILGVDAEEEENLIK